MTQDSQVMNKIKGDCKKFGVNSTIKKGGIIIMFFLLLQKWVVYAFIIYLYPQIQGNAINWNCLIY